MGLRQEDVAVRLGAIREVYDRWERDEREPAVSAWPRILSFLGGYPFPERTAADLVLKARRCKGTDQKRLAAHLGVIHQRLRKWENGLETPDIEMTVRLKELAAMPLAGVQPESSA